MHDDIVEPEDRQSEGLHITLFWARCSGRAWVAYAPRVALAG